MLKLRKVAITGSLSSGKSTVLKILKTLGATVVNADELTHQLLNTNVTIAHQVLHLLGDEVLREGKLDRSRIGKKVFNNPKKLQELEQRLHPQLQQEIERLYNEAALKGTSPLFAAEVPLLFEAAWETWYDDVLYVEADEAQCQQRFEGNRGLDKEDYKKRMDRQLAPDEKRARADHSITNNGSLEELEKKVTSYFKQLTQTHS